MKASWAVRLLVLWAIAHFASAEFVFENDYHIELEDRQQEPQPEGDSVGEEALLEAVEGSETESQLVDSDKILRRLVRLKTYTLPTRTRTRPVWYRPDLPSSSRNNVLSSLSNQNATANSSSTAGKQSVNVTSQATEPTSSTTKSTTLAPSLLATASMEPPVVPTTENVTTEETSTIASTDNSIAMPEQEDWLMDAIEEVAQSVQDDLSPYKDVDQVLVTEMPATETQGKVSLSQENSLLYASSPSTSRAPSIILGAVTSPTATSVSSSPLWIYHTRTTTTAAPSSTTARQLPMKWMTVAPARRGGAPVSSSGLSRWAVTAKPANASAQVSTTERSASSNSSQATTTIKPTTKKPASSTQLTTTQNKVQRSTTTAQKSISFSTTVLPPSTTEWWVSRPNYQFASITVHDHEDEEYDYDEAQSSDVDETLLDVSASELPPPVAPPHFNTNAGNGQPSSSSRPFASQQSTPRRPLSVTISTPSRPAIVKGQTRPTTVAPKTTAKATSKPLTTTTRRPPALQKVTTAAPKPKTTTTTPKPTKPTTRAKKPPAQIPIRQTSGKPNQVVRLPQTDATIVRPPFPSGSGVTDTPGLFQPFVSPTLSPLDADAALEIDVIDQEIRPVFPPEFEAALELDSGDFTLVNSSSSGVAIEETSVNFVVVNIWNYVGGQLTLVGQQVVPAQMLAGINITNGATIQSSTLPDTVLDQLTSLLVPTTTSTTTTTTTPSPRPYGGVGNPTLLGIGTVEVNATTNYGLPSPIYGVPNPPSATYGPPPPYVPPPSYTPAPSYLPPPPTFDPSLTYGPPPTYSPPLTYGPPPTYSPPAAYVPPLGATNTNLPPKPTYGAPPPSPVYGAPPSAGSTYTAPPVWLTQSAPAIGHSIAPSDVASSLLASQFGANLQPPPPPVRVTSTTTIASITPHRGQGSQFFSQLHLKPPLSPPGPPELLVSNNNAGGNSGGRPIKNEPVKPSKQPVPVRNQNANANKPNKRPHLNNKKGANAPTRGPTFTNQQNNLNLANTNANSANINANTNTNTNSGSDPANTHFVHGGNPLGALLPDFILESLVQRVQSLPLDTFRTPTFASRLDDPFIIDAAGFREGAPLIFDDGIQSNSRVDEEASKNEAATPDDSVVGRNARPQPAVQGPAATEVTDTNSTDPVTGDGVTTTRAKRPIAFNRPYDTSRLPSAMEVAYGDAAGVRLIPVDHSSSRPARPLVVSKGNRRGGAGVSSPKPSLKSKTVTSEAPPAALDESPAPVETVTASTTKRIEPTKQTTKADRRFSVQGFKSLMPAAAISAAALSLPMLVGRKRRQFQGWDDMEPETMGMSASALQLQKAEDDAFVRHFMAENEREMKQNNISSVNCQQLSIGASVSSAETTANHHVLVCPGRQSRTLNMILLDESTR